MEYTPKENIVEKQLALLLQETCSDVTPDTTEVTWNALEVSLEIPESSPEHAKAHQVDKHTAALARSIFDLWKSRRHNLCVNIDGSVSVLLEELLQQQEAQNHRTDEASGEKQIQEESIDPRQHLLTHLRLLATCHVQGSCTLTSEGQSKKIALDSPYFRYSIVSKNNGDEKSLVGFLVSPGDWIHIPEKMHD